MATAVSQHVRHLGYYFIFGKTVANFLEISRKNVFTDFNSNIIKNRVEKNKLEQILSKCYSFLSIQTLICIVHFA